MRNLLKDSSMGIVLLVLLLGLWHPGLDNHICPQAKFTAKSQAGLALQCPTLAISLQKQMLYLRLHDDVVAAYPLISHHLRRGRFTLRFIRQAQQGRFYCFVPLEDEVPLKDLQLSPSTREKQIFLHDGEHHYPCQGEAILDEEALQELYPYMRRGLALIIQA